MSITLAEAERVIQACKAKAREMNIKVSISVVDTRGDLIAMVRHEGARWITIGVSHGKAVASATYQVPSAQMTERAANPVMQSLMAMQGGHIVFGQGALPILKGDEVIGAVGVSGGTPQQDEDVARAGVNTL